HRELLVVLLAEYRRGWLHRVEELQHDGRHAVEEPGPEAALELLAERARMDEHGLRLRIQQVLGRRKNELHALGIEQAPVVVESARIALEILARGELQAIDEDAHRDRACVAPGEAHQRNMPGVQIAHRRHEGKGPERRRGRAQRGQVARDLHPRLKNSRRLRMPRMRDTRSSKSASRSTKLRFSEFTVSTGAAL